MTSGKVLLSFVLIASVLIGHSQAGIFSWFRSKPSWTKLIDKHPLIEAFHPKGLRVSISDVEGLEVFGFHGNLNKCFKRGEEGQTYGNVTKPTNGRWVFIDENIELKADDAVHYWIYVKKNGEEYSFSKEIYIVKSLIPYSGSLYLPNNFVDQRFDKTSDHLLGAAPNGRSGEKLCKCPDTNEIATFAPVPSNTPNVNNVPNFNNAVESTGTTVLPLQPVFIPVPSNNNNNAVESPGTTVLPLQPVVFSPVPIQNNDNIVPRSDNDVDNGNDLATELLSCSFQVDSLNEVILDLLRDTNMHSKLVLIGKPRENLSAPDEIRKFLVQYLELYDLGKKIKTAQYLQCGLYFEMSSIIDKKRILLRASTDMKNVSYKFLEPEAAGC